MMLVLSSLKAHVCHNMVEIIAIDKTEQINLDHIEIEGQTDAILNLTDKSNDEQRDISTICLECLRKVFMKVNTEKSNH